MSLSNKELVTQQQKTRALGWWLLGFLILLLPWMVRNVMLVGGPFFSLYRYEVLARTNTYPGESIWRNASAPLAPFFFAVSHPLEMVRKLLTSISQWWKAVPNLINPALAFLFLAALMGKMPDPNYHRLVKSTVASLVLCLGAACLLRPEPFLLLAWTPLLAMIGATHWVSWVSQPFPAVALTETTLTLRGRRGSSRSLNLGAWRLPGVWLRVGLYLVLGGVLVFPLFYFLSMEPRGPRSPAPEMVRPLSGLLTEEATILTDQPAWVAWYADRRAVWLFQHEEEWQVMERRVGPMDAAYITAGVAQMPRRERSDWWFALAANEGIHHHLRPVEPQPFPDQAMLRLRVPEEP